MTANEKHLAAARAAVEAGRFEAHMDGFFVGTVRALGIIEIHVAIALAAAEREGMKRAAKIAHGVGNFGNYKREELTEDYGQPRFDMMHEIVATILSEAEA